MRIVASAGRPETAVVYIGELDDGRRIEFVEALQPPAPREAKWILLISTMCGCPVGCKMCDAGGSFDGLLSREAMFDQVEALVRKRFPDRRVTSRQFKIQFARMGEPAYNMEVLDVMEGLPLRYEAPGFLPSISTVAPEGSEGFFERLLALKKERFAGGRFQFQFSVHSTDESRRRGLIPVKTWDFARMAAYGERFFEPNDRKLSLNFALASGSPVDAGVLLEHFDPGKFVVKLTPLNPTYRAREQRLSSAFDPSRPEEAEEVVSGLSKAGYQVILSVGEIEENLIGSNCGQYLRRHLEGREPIEGGYAYPLREGNGAGG